MDRELDESLIVRYLLRDSNDVELCDDEFQDIEMRCLADQEFFQQVTAIEDELIQSYVNGELPSEEKLRFELTYLNDPAKLEKIQFSRIMKGWFGKERK